MESETHGIIETWPLRDVKAHFVSDPSAKHACIVCPRVPVPADHIPSMARELNLARLTETQLIRFIREAPDFLCQIILTGEDSKYVFKESELESWSKVKQG
jgi:hypothetical protein